MTVRTFLLRLIRDYPCQRFVEAVTDYVEGTMPPSERRRFEAHLRRCDGCEHYLAQMRRTIEMTGRLRVDDVDALPVEGRARLLAAFEAYRQDG